MKRALIVDDSPVEQGKLQRILAEIGFTTLLAADGSEGVATAKSQNPDVVFMDVVMDGMNGYEATRILAKETPETAGIPVILCTSKGQKMDQSWGRTQGARAHIVKPATVDNVRDALTSIGFSA